MTKEGQELFRKLSTASVQTQASFLWYLFGYVTPSAIPNLEEALINFSKGDDQA